MDPATVRFSRALSFSRLFDLGGISGGSLLARSERCGLSFAVLFTRDFRQLAARDFWSEDQAGGHHGCCSRPLFLVLWAPAGFRLTCYYYRGAYYKAFWADPPACAVGEPRKGYPGENSFPLIMQNIHRYFLYIALLFILILAHDAWKAMWFSDGQGAKHFGDRPGDDRPDDERFPFGQLHLRLSFAPPFDRRISG